MNSETVSNVRVKAALDAKGKERTRKGGRKGERE